MSRRVAVGVPKSGHTCVRESRGEYVDVLSRCVDAVAVSIRRGSVFPFLYKDAQRQTNTRSLFERQIHSCTTRRHAPPPPTSMMRACVSVFSFSIANLTSISIELMFMPSATRSVGWYGLGAWEWGREPNPDQRFSEGHIAGEIGFKVRTTSIKGLVYPTFRIGYRFHGTQSIVDQRFVAEVGVGVW